ncbi:hypothetical protein HER14_00700 [Acidithiobacillus thiooxidans]|uniref:hypothetical protein n=1 Tax=Acidithiobacillus TaxID=119977 RepID=UPI00187964F1|nr:MULTISPECIES: hypothetical protein [Acidithiobacillus]MBE7567339.1 hypothetical protein [Acidithiobacillus sp. HP-11]MBU2749530.1 hypothetical protein [Acidithiobacillus thiooxidans]
MSDIREEPQLHSEDAPTSGKESMPESEANLHSDTDTEYHQVTQSQHEPEQQHYTHSETHSSTDTDASAAAAAAAAASSSSYSSYAPPPPPPAQKAGLLSRFWGYPLIILILLIIIVILFIWAITANQPDNTHVAVAAKPAQKVLHVTSAPSIAAITQNSKPLTADQTRLLMQARGAFWHHDYAGAIADYHHLIQEAPDSPAAYGEMGNVLYMTGHYHQAGNAYGQAAMQLIHAGRYADGAALIPILGRLDPAEAQKVQEALSHSPEAETGMPPA